MCEVHIKDIVGRKASFNTALVLAYKRLGKYVKFIVRKLLEEKEASNMRWCLYTSIWASM